MIKTLLPKAPLADPAVFTNSQEALFPTRGNGSVIEWPDDRQIQEVSARLARLRRVGIQLEAAGDYFRSGDMAYQMQEIIRTTAELFRKSQRARG